MAAKLNVILFMVDQLSAKWLEAARDEEICALPNLDWLPATSDLQSRYTGSTM